MKSRIFLLLFTALFFFALWGCQPSLLKKEPAATPDSVLFYQKEDVPDPFLDLVLHQPRQTVSLKTTVVPPPVPPKKFEEVPGFRVQVFASADSFNALEQKSKLQQTVQDSIYLIKEKGLYKVQTGNFVKRFRADSVKERIKRHGFPGAWVVTTTVRVPIDSLTSPAAPVANPPGTQAEQPQAPFKIQVFVTSSQSKAQNLVDRLKAQFDFPCFFAPDQQVFKVFVGGFQTRAQAENALTKIKRLGYPDAWIVHN